VSSCRESPWLLMNFSVSIRLVFDMAVARDQVTALMTFIANRFGKTLKTGGVFLDLSYHMAHWSW